MRYISEDFNVENKNRHKDPMVLFGVSSVRRRRDLGDVESVILCSVVRGRNPSKFSSRANARHSSSTVRRFKSTPDCLQFFRHFLPRTLPARRSVLLLPDFSEIGFGGVALRRFQEQITETVEEASSRLETRLL